MRPTPGDARAAAARLAARANMMAAAAKPAVRCNGAAAGQAAVLRCARGVGHVSRARSGMQPSRDCSAELALVGARRRREAMARRLRWLTSGGGARALGS